MPLHPSQRLLTPLQITSAHPPTRHVMAIMASAPSTEGHELRLARQGASPHCRPEACKQSSALLLLVIVIALCHLGKGWGKPRVVGLDSHKAQGQQ